MAFRHNEVFPGHEVQIGNFPPVSIEELRQAGIYWSPSHGLGKLPANLPLASTQADKDRLILAKKNTIKRLNCMANFTLVCSIAAIAIGIAAIATSAPDFNMPHVMGGAIITGIMGLLQVRSTYSIIREVRITASEDKATNRFHCLYRCNICSVVLALYFTLVPVVGISGIWGIVDCNREKKPDDYDQQSNSKFPSTRGNSLQEFSKCEPNTQALLILAFASLGVGVLVYFMIVLMCCTMCTNARSLGIKSNYERFLDYMSQKASQAGQTIGTSAQFQQTYGVLAGPQGLVNNSVFEQPTPTLPGTPFSLETPRYAPPPPPSYQDLLKS